MSYTDLPTDEKTAAEGFIRYLTAFLGLTAADRTVPASPPERAAGYGPLRAQPGISVKVVPLPAARQPHHAPD
jgi:hypothetical protein